MVSTTSLNGTWLFRADPKRLGELYAEDLHYTHAPDARWSEPGTDLSQCSDIKVPGLWTRQGHPDLECGWYRHDFRVTAHDGLTTLIFDGVDYFSDVWLNGHYLGGHEGYLGRFAFDISDLLQAENALVVRVDSPVDVLGHKHEIGQMKRMFRGALERWDMNDPDSKPAGIWGAVRLEHTGSVRVASAVITATPTTLPPQGNPDAPVALTGQIALILQAGAAAHTTVRYEITPLDFEASTAKGEVAFSTLPGERPVSLDFALDDARLWWTWDLGQQRRYEVQIDVLCDGIVSHTHVFTTGFRTLALGQGWDLRLNGVKLYQRGANYLSDLDLSSMTHARYEQDIALFRQANLNTVHPFAVVEADGFYDACDAAGLIVYQDFPIWMMSSPDSETVRAAIRQFDDMLARLRHHPAVAIWNMGSQPSVANFEKLCSALVRHARQRDPERIAHYGNSAVTYEPSSDTHPSRSFFWREASAERFEERYGWHRDCHMYPGWYFGGPEAIAQIQRSHFTLVTEFGAQALPRRATLEQFIPADSVDIPWKSLAARCAQPFLLKRHCPDAITLDDLIEMSQRYQARVVRHDIEYIRSQKSDSNGGLHLFAFSDCWPAVTWSVVEYDRTPKLAYAAVQVAMAPVQVFLGNYLQPFADGETTLEMTIVNDTPNAITGAVLTIALAGETREVPVANVDASGVLRITATMATRTSEAAVTLELRWSGGEVINTYSAQDRLPSPPMAEH